MTDEPSAPAPRTRAERIRDTRHRLTHDVDVWVATASADGEPHLVPLSFAWGGETILLATPADSVTGRNLTRSGTVRLGLGPTRDVTMVEGRVETVALTDLPADEADRFASVSGFDPRPLDGYCWFRVTPVRVQAWREVDELAGRDLVRDGRWLDRPS